MLMSRITVAIEIQVSGACPSLQTMRGSADHADGRALISIYLLSNACGKHWWLFLPGLDGTHGNVTKGCYKTRSCGSGQNFHSVFERSRRSHEFCPSMGDGGPTTSPSASAIASKFSEKRSLCW